MFRLLVCLSCMFTDGLPGRYKREGRLLSGLVKSLLFLINRMRIWWE